MSELLTKEEVVGIGAWTCTSAEMRRDIDALRDSHEALRAALAESQREVESLTGLARDIGRERDELLELRPILVGRVEKLSAIVNPMLDDRAAFGHFTRRQVGKEIHLLFRAQEFSDRFWSAINSLLADDGKEKA